MSLYLNHSWMLLQSSPFYNDALTRQRYLDMAGVNPSTRYIALYQLTLRSSFRIPRSHYSRSRAWSPCKGCAYGESENASFWSPTTVSLFSFLVLGNSCIVLSFGDCSVSNCAMRYVHVADPCKTGVTTQCLKSSKCFKAKSLYYSNVSILPHLREL